MISVCIPTYNRPGLLPRAVASVLKQDVDLEIVIIDDESDSPVELFSDPRIRVVRNRVNQGALHGDMPHLRKFLKYYCNGDSFLYLCDDDYLIPGDLLSRQYTAMRENNLSFVQGGMAQQYEKPIHIIPNADHLTYEHLNGERTQIFARGLFPSHRTMSGDEYLFLLASDPRNRNIVVGATLFDTEKFMAAGALDRCAGVKRQMGFARPAGSATPGPVLYMAEPCVMATPPTMRNISFHGTQMDHLCEILSSISAGIPDHPARGEMSRKMLMTYVSNKFGHRFGWFPPEVMSHFEPPITADEFLRLAHEREVPITEGNKEAILLSDNNPDQKDWNNILKMVA